MSETVLVFAGSLAGILFLILIAALLRLGGQPVLADEHEALALAEEAVCGFGAVRVGRDAAGHAALVGSHDERIILLSPHGAHFAARLLDAQSRAWLDSGQLIVSTGEKLFRTVSLDLGTSTEAWERRIAALHGR